MITGIPTEITIASFSLVGVLTGYIWNSQSKRIDRIVKIQSSLPCNVICSQIGTIKNDIQWIKEEIKKSKWQS